MQAGENTRSMRVTNAATRGVQWRRPARRPSWKVAGKAWTGATLMWVLEQAPEHLKMLNSHRKSAKWHRSNLFCRRCRRPHGGAAAAWPAHSARLLQACTSPAPNGTCARVMEGLAVRLRSQSASKRVPHMTASVVRTCLPGTSGATSACNQFAWLPTGSSMLIHCPACMRTREPYLRACRPSSCWDACLPSCGMKCGRTAAPAKP